MNKENFQKGIDGLKNIRLTDTEKTRMLERIFSTPIKSPYMKRIPAFAYVYSLFLMISLGGATYASGMSLPGDLLYPIKTRVVEPVLDVVNHAPEKKVVWEEQKINRRIMEAERLVEENNLDDKKLEELERSVEKSSIAFVKAVNVAASSTATSTVSAREREKNLKREFRRKINERKEAFEEDDEDKKELEIKATSTDKISEEQSDDNKRKSSRKKRGNQNQKEKIKKLKDTAIKIVDDEDKSRDERSKDNRKNGDDGDD